MYPIVWCWLIFLVVSNPRNSINPPKPRDTEMDVREKEESLATLNSTALELKHVSMR